MKLNRAGAVAYARAHWDTVCDDGVFWFSNYSVNVEQKRRELKASVFDGWKFKFRTFKDGEQAIFTDGRTEKIVGQDPGIADCAHYLSRCLIKGGGADLKGARSPAMLIMELQEKAATITLVEKATRAEAQAVIDSGVFKPGDMIGYFNISPDGDYGGRRIYSHSTMFVGHIKSAGRITCHTICRFGGETPDPKLFPLTDEWHLGSDHYLYTLMHFASDDVAPPKEALGWWSIEGVAVLPTYLKIAGNAAVSSPHRPTNQAQSAQGKDKARVFAEGGKLIFVWRQSAKVETWTPRKDGGFEVTSAGSGTRLAMPLFVR